MDLSKCKIVWFYSCGSESSNISSGYISRGEWERGRAGEVRSYSKIRNPYIRKDVSPTWGLTIVLRYL